MSFSFAGRWAGGAGFFINTAGVPQPNHAVSVFNRGTAVLASLYTDRTKGTGASNPTSTDSLGNLQFFADPGEYDLLPAGGTTIQVSVVRDGAEPDGTVGTVGDNTVTSAKIVDGTIVNADISASAAIAKSKLAPFGITNADVDAAAAIAYSKLNLALGITNGDISASAGIVKSKLAALAIVNADVDAAAAIAKSKLAALAIVDADVSAISESKVTNLVADLAAKATDSLIVHLAGTETITGAKSFSAALTLSDVNVVLGTTTGTKIGTATTQKLGFFNTTPAVQPAGSVDVLASLVTLGLRAASSNPPLNLGTGVLTAGASALAASTLTTAVIGHTTLNGYTLNVTRTADTATQIRFGGTATDAGGFLSSTGAAVSHFSSGVAFNGTNWIAKQTSCNILSLNNAELVLFCNTGATIGASVAPNERLRISATTMTLADAQNIIVGSTTGTKIGTASTQKLAAFGNTPIVRPTGWAAATGTKARTTFVTDSVTLPNLAARVGALIDDLLALGWIGA